MATPFQQQSAWLDLRRIPPQPYGASRPADPQPSYEPHSMPTLRMRVNWFNPASIPPPTPPPFNDPPIASSSGPSQAIVYNLANQAFEPLWSFSEIIRASAQTQVSLGTTWDQLTNNWNTYTQTWDSFTTTNDLSFFIATNVGQVHNFNVRFGSDDGTSIPYGFTTALFTASSTRENVLLDSVAIYINQSTGGAETVTMQFYAQTQPLGTPTAYGSPITITLNNPATYSVAKMAPTLNQYQRYFRLKFTGSTTIRTFGYVGGTVFVYQQERPSA